MQVTFKKTFYVVRIFRKGKGMRNCHLWHGFETSHILILILQIIMSKCFGLFYDMNKWYEMKIIIVLMKRYSQCVWKSLFHHAKFQIQLVLLFVHWWQIRLGIQTIREPSLDKNLTCCLITATKNIWEKKTGYICLNGGLLIIILKAVDTICNYYN